jgi:hypothetical protein
MKLFVSSQQHEYFQTHHLIEFEGILPKEEVSVLQENIEKALSARLRVPLERLGKESPEKLFKAGLFLGAASSAIWKLMTSSKLSSLASQLCNQKPLRIGYDIYISPENAPFLNPIRPFQEICCIQGMVGGIFICLEGEKVGNVVYFSPELQIEPSKIFGGAPFLMMTYTHSSALFIRRVEDPLFLEMQERGYQYGDRLTDEFNPIIYK